MTSLHIKSLYSEVFISRHKELRSSLNYPKMTDHTPLVSYSTDAQGLLCLTSERGFLLTFFLIGSMKGCQVAFRDSNKRTSVVNNSSLISLLLKNIEAGKVACCCTTYLVIYQVKKKIEFEYIYICGQILFSVNHFILIVDDINKHQETNTCNSSYGRGPTLGSQYFDYHDSAGGKYLPKEKLFQNYLHKPTIMLLDDKTSP